VSPSKNEQVFLKVESMATVKRAKIPVWWFFSTIISFYPKLMLCIKLTRKRKILGKNTLGLETWPDQV